MITIKLKCNICRKDFKEGSIIYIYNRNLGFVCEDCNYQFSKVDIEDFIFLFKQFGGFFGKMRNDKHSFMNVLVEFFNGCSNNYFEDFIEENMKFKHKALLYGITPHQIIEKMKDLI